MSVGWNLDRYSHSCHKYEHCIHKCVSSPWWKAFRIYHWWRVHGSSQLCFLRHTTFQPHFRVQSASSLACLTVAASNTSAAGQTMMHPVPFVPTCPTQRGRGEWQYDTQSMQRDTNSPKCCSLWCVQLSSTRIGRLHGFKLRRSFMLH